MAIDVKFKFTKGFKTFVNETNEEELTNAFQKFIGLKVGHAARLLWEMTYSEEKRDSALAELGLSTEQLPEGMTVEMLRDELCHQYRKTYKRFMKADISEACEAAYKEMVKLSDEVTAYNVFKLCENAKRRVPEYYEATLGRLTSKKAETVFGGMRNLVGKNHDDVIQYLLPYVQQIRDLYEVLCKEYTAECAAARGETAGQNSPMNDTPAEPEVSEVAPCSVKLTAEAVLKHSGLFSEFLKDDDMNVLVEIGKLGFDLNEVISKKDKIDALFTARENIFNAELAVRKAEERLSSVKDAMSNAADALDAEEA